jgi:hypothetical protein
MSAVERMELIVFQGDFEKLSGEPGGLDYHVSQAFRLWDEVHKRDFTIRPRLHTDFWRPGCGPFKDVLCEVDADAAALLRTFGGSFKEVAHDAIRLYARRLVPSRSGPPPGR